MSESVEFIAEQPHVDGCDITMPWPDESVFVAIRDEQYGIPEEDESEEKWYSRNNLYNVRDEYFRMRYRGATWPWNAYNSGEELSEEPETKLGQLLSRGYWAPATDEALGLYEEQGDEKYRTTAVFACGLHIWDVLNHSWTFLDPSLANNSGVREKHYLGFLMRVADVNLLDMDSVEREYFDKLKMQFFLAYAEMAAQSPLTGTRDLEMYEEHFRQAHPGLQVEESRSTMLSFADAPHALKVRIVERFKQSALDGMHDEFGGSPYYRMHALHLFGIVNKQSFYTQGAYDNEPSWWRLSAEEILAGDTSNMYVRSSEPDDKYIQDSLF